MKNVSFYLGAFLLCLWVPRHLVSSPEKLRDFEFRRLDVRQAVTAIAKLSGKNVVFSPSVKPVAVDLSLKQVTASTAFRILLKNYTLDSVEEKDGIIRVIPSSERGPASVSTAMIPLKNILAKEIEANLKSFLGPSGSVSIHEQTNSIIINSDALGLSRARELINQLDQQNRQVFIEAKIIETSTTFARQLGVEWGPSLSALGTQVAGLALSARSPSSTFQVGTTIANPLQLEARISAGERNGDLKVVSSPKVMTLNGMPATIESSITFNVRTLAPVSGGTSNGTSLAGGLQPVKAGVRLKVTPSIVSQEKIRLDLSISKSDPDFSQLIDGIPGISDNSAATSLIVANGETASIGGLIYQSQSASSSGAPFLSKIPLIGIFFGSQENESRERELLIFLTPRISNGDRS